MASYSPMTAVNALWQMRVRKRPYVLSHAVNSSCNMRCRFCEYWKESGPQMELEKVFSLLDEAKGFGIQVYNAWTVEPLLRDDLPLIFKHAKDLGMTTSMITNGLLLEKRVHELKDLDLLSVSVDGTASYKEMRGVDFKRILPGIIKAREVMGKAMLMNCVINGKNLDDIEELIVLAKEKDLKISFEPMYEFASIESGTWNEFDIKDMEKYRNTVDMIIRMKKNGYPVINSNTYLKMVRDRRTSFTCHANDLILCVAADGSIENCRVYREPIGNISEGIAKVWERTREKRKEVANNCEKCLFFGYVENSMLYEFNPEVIMHYKWM